MANALSIPGGGHKAAATPLQPAWLPAWQAFASARKPCSAKNDSYCPALA